MFFYHLRLLIQKSLRYAWRRRICRCCPKIIFELCIPAICILILILIRWVHTTPSSTTPSTSTNDKSSRIQIVPSEIRLESQSSYVFNYTSILGCPTSDITIQVVDEKLLNRLKRSCSSANFIAISESNRSPGQILINKSSIGHTINYRCPFHTKSWCKNPKFLYNDQDSVNIKHPSSYLCSKTNLIESTELLKTYLSIESLLYSPIENQRLTVYTLPCSSYGYDSLFEYAPRFVLVCILLLIDGCIIFNFHMLFGALLDEKSQGITELLRLISIRPILNSFAWFLRVFIIQLIVAILLIIILKIPFDGEIYLRYVSIWLIIPTIILWTIQVLSRSVLIAHFFSSNLKATLWSWFIYIISCWLALSSIVRLPIVLHLFASMWLPFYTIKRLFILLFRINTDLGRSSYLITELLLIWLYMIIGSFLMWCLAYYFEQIRPGKYGIPRPWTWPLDSIRNNRIKNQKRRESVTMQMVETFPDANTTIRVNNLTKTYGGFHREKQLAVDHVSFKLEKSIIHGLIGHNGAGKTSTMEMMCGLLSCDCGTIEIHDQNLYENISELRKCIGYCPQQDTLFSHLTVREQLEFHARVRSKQNTIDNNQITELLRMMDMDKFSERLCHTLSGGMQRKLSILCAFAGEANIILLDEPSSSLDPVARRTLWSWLRENKHNRTLLISSHLLDEVEELCDNVIILDSGKIRAQGTILELKKQFGPPGDRLHLDKIPSYIPQDWILDEKTNFIQIPNRQQLISTLEKLDTDHIKYSLENITLDDIFLRLTSSNESFDSNEDNKIKSQIRTLFETRTHTQRTYLWSQQILGILIKRGQVFFRRARLLPIVILIYIAYALTPLYMPSFSLTTTEDIQYIISTPSELIQNLPLKNIRKKLTPTFYSSGEFQEYLLQKRKSQSSYSHLKTIVGLRIPTNDQLECYVPSPVPPNIILSCLPIYQLFTNQTFAPFELIDKDENNPLSDFSFTTLVKDEKLYFCMYTVPFNLHLSIILLTLILIIPAAFTIQDYSSGLHSYSIIHGLRSVIHWMIIFLSDLILCLIWLSILIIIERFVYSSTFHGRFFALIPLFFIANLPFIYLLAKVFRRPIIGATVIIFILLIVHMIYTFRVIIEVFRSYKAVGIIITILRWSLIIIFPNINVLTLIITILRKYSCPFTDTSVPSLEGFLSDEVYSNKTLIHVLILLAQFCFYFGILILIDSCRFTRFTRKIRGTINQNDEDNDVAQERYRIDAMTNEDEENEALIVNNLSKRYFGSSVPAVNRLTFAVPHRQCFGLLGFNGSGKTTTFRMLVGELHPTGGSIHITNKESIGYCPQDDISFPALTVLQSINYICRLHGIQPGLINNLILSQFQLERYHRRLVSDLSGGTRRRLHLALCLIGSPTLLLLDEPTAKVDPLLRSHIRLILQHRPVDTSIVFASHSMLECEQLCDRITILVRGNARCLGSPLHLKEKYGIDYRIRLTPIQSSYNIPTLQRVDNTNEYTYPKSSLANLFKLLENLAEQNIIQSNYTVQLTSLEHIFLAFQHPANTIV